MRQTLPLSMSALSTQAPEKVRGCQVMNISLRKLHRDNQPRYARPAIAAFQRLLRTTAAGPAFFRQVARRDAVRKVRLR